LYFEKTPSGAAVQESSVKNLPYAFCFRSAGKLRP
jgi:hypothetical protein